MEMLCICLALSFSRKIRKKVEQEIRSHSGPEGAITHHILCPYGTRHTLCCVRPRHRDRRAGPENSGVVIPSPCYTSGNIDITEKSDQEEKTER
ncbi:hypothetical protein DQC13_26040 [Salmonella enterica subsp. enterica serovar Gatow]|nr:hypothetical protein [Salmonella enterica subsp. enterica serovar Gatow]